MGSVINGNLFKALSKLGTLSNIYVLTNYVYKAHVNQSKENSNLNILAFYEIGTYLFFIKIQWVGEENSLVGLDTGGLETSKINS